MDAGSGATGRVYELLLRLSALKISEDTSAPEPRSIQISPFNDQVAPSPLSLSLGLRGDVRVSGVESAAGRIWFCPPRPGSLFRAPLLLEEGGRWLIELTNLSPLPDTLKPIRVSQAGGLYELDLNGVVGEIALPTPGGTLSLLVMSWKLDDTAQPTAALETLLAEVWERHIALSRQQGGIGGVEMGVGAHLRAPFHTLMLLDRLLHVDGVREAWGAMTASPPATLQIDRPIIAAEKARHPLLAGAAVRSIRLNAEDEIVRLRDRRPHHTTDTPALRLAVSLARLIARLSHALIGVLRGGIQDRAVAAWLRRATEIRGQAEALLAHPACAEIPTEATFDPCSPTLLHNALCRPMLRAWSLLLSGIGANAHGEALFRDPLKKSYELYEYWCWFALIDAIHFVLYNQEGRTSAALVKTIRSTSWTGAHHLSEGQWLNLSSEDTFIDLWYNRSAGSGINGSFSSYSHSWAPDFLMIIIKNDKISIIALDAKYRVKLFDQTKGEAKHDDLKVMHGYRDALRVDGQAPRWVLTLFPGTEVHVFPEGAAPNLSREPSALASTASPRGGIGALPASPGDTKRLRDGIAALLRG